MQIVIEVKDRDLGKKILNILSLFCDEGIIVKEVIPATDTESFVEKLRETVREFPLKRNGINIWRKSTVGAVHPCLTCLWSTGL